MSRNSTPPLRLAVGYLKGGTAKSTTAVLLALCLAQRTTDPIALLDTDQSNPTTMMWHRVAAEEWPQHVTVERWTEGDPESPAEMCTRLLDTHRHLIVDTGPDRADVLADVLTVTDDLLCPLLASPAEVMSMRPTLSVAAQAAQTYGADLHVLLTKVRRNSVHRRDARDRMEEMELPVMNAEIPLLDRYMMAPGTVPEDPGDYAAVLDELTHERTTR